METELWPNLLAQCGKQNLPVVILNARLSEKSCQRYQRISHFFRQMSQALTLLLCQHRDDARCTQRGRRLVSRRCVMGASLERLRRHCSLTFHPVLNFWPRGKSSPEGDRIQQQLK